MVGELQDSIDGLGNRIGNIEEKMESLEEEAQFTGDSIQVVSSQVTTAAKAIKDVQDLIESNPPELAESKRKMLLKEIR